MSKFPTNVQIAIASIAVVAAAACSHGAGGMLPAQSAATSAQEAPSPEDDVSVLKLLTKEVEIGSTVDPKHGQLNPYGLTIAPSTVGDLKKGDLVVSNFNAKSNVQGTGFTIVALHPVPGSKPRLVSDNKTLVGTSALAMGPPDDIWAAAYSADDNPVITPTGGLEGDIKGKSLDRPWGQVFAQHGSTPDFYETNAGDGTIARIDALTFTHVVIAKGFAVNHGKPGSIFAPSGLAYDAKIDTLYIVDGANDTVVAFSDVSKVPSGGITVAKDGKTFTGPSAGHARLVFAGAPLDGPISSALLPNGNLVIGNTSNPTGHNVMVELTPSGKVLDTLNVDKGAAGALFGMVATGTSDSDTKVYFNDDNSNDLRVLER